MFEFCWRHGKPQVRILYKNYSGFSQIFFLNELLKIPSKSFKTHQFLFKFASSMQCYPIKIQCQIQLNSNRTSLTQKLNNFGVSNKTNLKHETWLEIYDFLFVSQLIDKTHTKTIFLNYLMTYTCGNDECK